MKPVLFVILPALLVNTVPAQAQSSIVGVGISAEVVGGVSTWNEAPGKFGLFGINGNVTLAGFLVVGAELTRAALESPGICTLTCGAMVSTPQLYTAVHGQIQAPLGIARPYFGASIGSVSDCAFGESCGTVALEGGLRIKLVDRLGVVVAGRHRTDDRYDGSGGKTRAANEYRVGASFTIK